MDSPTCNESQASDAKLLSAEALIQLRNSTDVLKMQSVGQKGYTPEDDPAEAEQVSALLEDRQRMLEQERTARIGDLMQAHWEESLGRAVTSRLKGKFTRHMGKVINGQTTLSPEETVFLLENGFLELTKDGVPISTEEVYSIVLKKPLSLEKYQVYSHMSRLGYLVIGHQEKLNISESNTIDETEIPSAPKEVVDLSEKTSVDSCVSGHDGDHLLNGIVNHNIPIINNDAQSQPDTIAPKENSVSEPVEESNELSNGGCSNAEDVEGELQMDVEEEDEIECDKMEDEPPLPVLERFEPVRIPTEDDDSSNTTEVDPTTSVESSSVDVESGDEDSNPDTPKNLVMKTVANGESCSAAASSGSKQGEGGAPEKPTTSISPRVSVIKHVDEASNKVSSSSECTESSERGSSSSEEELVYLGDTGNSVESAAKPPAENAEEDEDVIFVEVTKKERQPLAVIDLLSDDDDDNDSDDSDKSDSENEDNEEEDDDDDDIQVIAICPKPTVSATRRKRKREKYLDYNTDVKRERRGHSPVDTQQQEFNNTIQFPFPNLLRKTLVCLPRPPLHLVPLNVRVNKEAYTLDLKMLTPSHTNMPKPRLWNSYKDLQERQRTNQHHNQPFSPNFGDSPENRRQNRSPRPFLPPINSPGDHAPFSCGAPLLPFKREEPNIPCPNPNMPPHGPFVSRQQISDYIRHAQQTAMQVAQNVLSHMTTNMPFFGADMPPLIPPCHDLPGFSHSFNHSQSQHMSRMYPFPGQSMQQTIEQNRSLSFHPNPRRVSAFRDPRVHDVDDQTYSNNQRTDMYIGFNHNRSQSGPGQQPDTGYNSPMFDEPFPSSIPKVSSSTKSWSEFKSALGEDADVNVDCDDEDDGDDVLEIPIENAEILYGRIVKPLAKSGELSLEDTIKGLQVFKPVNLLTDGDRQRCFMLSSELKISFDVYLPGSSYKKSCLSTPALRLVVLQANDQLPRMSEILSLQRKYCDESTIKFSVVSEGEVAFYSFSCLHLRDVSSV